MTTARIAIAGIVLLLAAGCGKNIETPFQDDARKSPILKQENHHVVAGVGVHCKPDSSGNYPKDNFVVADKGETAQFFFGQGGGCIARSLRETIAAAQNQESLAFNGSDLIGFENVPNPAQGNFLFQTRYSAGPAMFKQRWTIEWYHTITEGTLAAPSKAIIRYKKTFGSSYIELWQGTLELEALTPEMTSLVMRNEIKAPRIGVDDAIGTVKDTLGHLRTAAPNWQFLGGPPKPSLMDEE